MSDYMSMIDSKFCVGGEHITGWKVYIYVAKNVGWVLPYMNQEPGHLSFTDPTYMYDYV
jgi:hypothetical protein